MATFVPVAGKAAAAGAATGTAATAGVAVTGAGAVTEAAPLVLMAIAVSVSAYADHQRQAAIERITDLLEQLHEDKLGDERSELGGCRDAIDKATSILLDQGRIGAVSGSRLRRARDRTSIERTRKPAHQVAGRARRRCPRARSRSELSRSHSRYRRGGWRLPCAPGTRAGSRSPQGRVLVLQAVEHAQLERASHPFKTFVRSLQDDERREDDAELQTDRQTVPPWRALGVETASSRGVRRTRPSNPRGRTSSSRGRPSSRSTDCLRCRVAIRRMQAASRSRATPAPSHPDPGVRDLVRPACRYGVPSRRRGRLGTVTSRIAAATATAPTTSPTESCSSKISTP